MAATMTDDARTQWALLRTQTIGDVLDALPPEMGAPIERILFDACELLAQSLAERAETDNRG